MTRIFAHRGYAAKFPENTMIAFKKAAEVGADGIEIDVQFTKDKEIVLIHDLKVDRTTNGTGYVKDYSLKQLKELEANFRFKNIEKQSIPTLVEFFEWLRTTDLDCIIEIKNAQIRYEGLEEEILRLINEYSFENRIVISSFNHYSLVKISKLAPYIETAPLYRDGLYRPWKYAKEIKSRAIHPSYIVASDEIIKKSIHNDVAVRPFTVNKDKEMRRLFNINCSAIITDEVELAVKIRNLINN